jgi:hypothetical protein
VSVLPESALPRCCECERPLERVALYEIVGFERDRAQGGTNHVVARRRTGRVVGSCCVLRVQAGLGEQQALEVDV